jgi:hypothetical protein
LFKFNFPPHKVIGRFNCIISRYGGGFSPVNSQNDRGEVYNTPMPFTSVNSAQVFSDMSQSDRDSIWPYKHAPERGLIGGLRGQIGPSERYPFQLQVYRPVAACQIWCPTQNFTPIPKLFPDQSIGRLHPRTFPGPYLTHPESDLRQTKGSGKVTDRATAWAQ